jgi:hypothetical protein
MQHTATSFNYGGQYRGYSCSCGFSATSGDKPRDENAIKSHIEKATGFVWPNKEKGASKL